MRSMVEGEENGCVIDGSSLVIICPREAYDSTRNFVDARCHRSWSESGRLRILRPKAMALREVGRIAARVREQYSGHGLTVWVHPSIEIREDWFPAEAVVIRVDNIAKARKQLASLLVSLELDLVGSVVRAVGRAWEHSRLDREHVTTWIRQFETLGSHGWVAKRLLQGIDFWPTERTLDALKISEDGLEGIDCITTNRYVPGRSGDALAVKVRKRLRGFKSPSVPLEALDVALKGGAFRQIAVVEDSLISGDEFERVIRALVGDLATGQTGRAERLEDLQALRERKLLFRFAVVTDIGLSRFASLVARYALGGFRLDCGSCRLYRLMSEAGQQALDGNAFFDHLNCIVDQDGYINYPAFAPDLWRAESRRQRAIHFCRSIGAQLFSRYAEREGKRWNEARVDQAGIGYGLLLAFSHSIPKLTLPILWLEGDCEFEGRRLHWEPLFRNAQ
ncbi:MAG: hypothetical protein U0002_12905 [Thermoanaerobaculia bacterium]